MNNVFKSLAILCICSFAYAQAAFAQNNRGNKIDMNILYVGGSSDYAAGVEGMSKGENTVSDPEIVKQRSDAFMGLLQTYFTNVTMVAGKDYSPELSAGYDVTVFDGTIPRKSDARFLKDQNGRNLDYFRAAFLPQDFSYPAILIAELGEVLGRTIGTKTDWFCLCLAGDAYNTNLEHAVFNTPFKVEPQMELKDTPEEAFGYQGYFDQPIPQKHLMWKVQTKDYVNDRKFRIGMVARPWGFADSPDAEIISGGVSVKSPDAVAIARHGNFFFWGFSASPLYMTDQAKLVFVNSVVYTAGLKGERIVARKYDDNVGTPSNVTFAVNQASQEGYDSYVAYSRKTYEKSLEAINKIKARQENGEVLSEEEKMYLTYPLSEDIMPYEQYLKMYMRGFEQRFGTDAEAFRNFLTENEPFIYCKSGAYEVDEDAKSLGMPIGSIDLLEAAISLLDSSDGEKIAKGHRLLERYSLCTFHTYEQWSNWYESVKGRVFFTHSGGWYYMVNSNDLAEPANDYDAKAFHVASRDIALDETSNLEPVAVGAGTVVLPGGREYLLIKMKVHDGYYIYGNVSASDPFIPTSLNIGLPDGYSAGELVKPVAKLLNSAGTTKYSGELLFLVPIKGSGKQTLVVHYEYQCCDPTVCYPPVVGQIEVVSKF